MRALLSISGPDALVFLNGLLTRDVGEAITYAALLTPQGKIFSDLFVWRAGEGFLLDAAPDRAAALAQRLAMYRLRARVEIGPGQAAGLAGAPDPRLAALPARKPGEAGDRAAEIAAGAPDLSLDAAPEEVFALEGLLEELNGVDFKKGCFPGQENVSRMKRRATTRRKFCRLAWEGSAPAPGAAVTAGAAELGNVRAVADNKAIALLRLDRALEAVEKGEVLMAEGGRVRLDPPPWLILPRAEAE